MKITTLEALALLYDRTAHELREVVSAAAGGASNVPLHSEQMQSKVKWLGDIAKTLSLVYQVEKLRANSEENRPMPQEKIIDDPAAKKANNAPSNVSQDVSQFPGWKPF